MTLKRLCCSSLECKYSNYVWSNCHTLPANLKYDLQENAKITMNENCKTFGQKRRTLTLFKF